MTDIFGRGTRVYTPMAGSPGNGYGNAELLWMPDATPQSRVGYNGAPQTIEVMSQSALDDQKHFETRQLAEIICEGLDSKDYVSEYLAGFYYLLGHSRYMRDPRRTELVKAAYIISKQMMAGHRPSIDCDDCANWLASYCLAVGGNAQFATVAFNNAWYNGQRQYSHVFTCAIEPRARTRIILDPVAAEKTKQMLGRVQGAHVYAPLTS